MDCSHCIRCHCCSLCTQQGYCDVTSSDGSQSGFSLPRLDLSRLLGHIRFGLVVCKSVSGEKRRNGLAIPASFHNPNPTNIAAPPHSSVCPCFTSGSIVLRTARRFRQRLDCHWHQGLWHPLCLRRCRRGWHKLWWPRDRPAGDRRIRDRFVCFGGLGLGFAAIGGAAIGYMAFGGGAIGWLGASGGATRPVISPSEVVPWPTRQ